MAYADLTQGRRRSAWEHHRQALETALAQENLLSFPYLVVQRAQLLADSDERVLALELFALAARYPALTNTHWWREDTQRQITTIADTLPPDVVAAAQERGRARDLEGTVRELLEELEE